ncbi:hypothetical protein [Demequina lignilytica]|uniref:O-antigen ligase n=1 Tax=Demequina lignilytica TaxID=3051663 RepID=A0AB35MK75_9MICO|nr:hypothetical protein [Demequina sp. SYSU T0a273]MDN4484168.1 hypothetical protein [Demequina sp. SYSU T0a273]
MSPAGSVGPTSFRREGRSPSGSPWRGAARDDARGATAGVSRPGGGTPTRSSADGADASSRSRGVERLVLVAFVGALITAAALGIAFGLGLAGPSQGFAANGVAKRLILPGFFALLLVAMMLSGRRLIVGWRLPVWWWTVAIGLVASTVGVIVAGGIDANLSAFMQAAFLIVSALGLFVLGQHAAGWSPRTVGWIFVVLVGATVMSLVLSTNSLVPFVGVAVPTIAALLMVGIRTGHVALRWLAAALAVWMAVDTLGRFGDVSVALLAQVGVSALVLAALLAPVWMRSTLLVVAAVGAVAFAVREQLLGMLVGVSDYSDVTLAQRGYETAATWSALTEGSVFTMMVGLGPSGALDLTGAPDAASLIAGGRDIEAVDDTHLLSTWFLLKLGLVGVVALVALLASVAARARGVLVMRRPPLVDAIALLYVASGLAFALPAATNLFTAPMMFLALGLLDARARRAAATVPAPSDAAPATPRHGHRVTTARQHPWARTAPAPDLDPAT